MARIDKFEDFDAWRSARKLTKSVYDITREGGFSKDYGLRDQIRRAAVSIMSNIAEGFGRGGNKEFSHFLSTARGSASEVQAQLYVATDVGYISHEQFSSLFEETQKTIGLISGLMEYLSRSKFKGPKYKHDD